MNIVYMCYLDESGVQENAGTQYFVLTGLAIPAEQWKSLEKEIAQCKRKRELEEEEIHAAWMARRYIEQEQIPGFASLSPEERRRATLAKRDESLIKMAARSAPAKLKEAKKNYRKTAAYVHLSIDERRGLLKELAEIIGGWQAARLFAEVIDKKYVYGSASHPYTPFEFSFRELVQRYEYFLRNRGNAIGKALHGLIVQDNNETMARRLTSMMRRFHDQGTKWTDIDHIY